MSLIRCGERIRHGRGYIRKMECDYLAYALIDSIIDHYYPVLESLGDGIEELETEVLEHPNRSCVSHDPRSPSARSCSCAASSGRVATSSRRCCTMRASWSQDTTKVFLRDCYDHTVQLMDLLETYRDVNSGLMELYLSAVGHAHQRDHARAHDHVVHLHPADLCRGCLWHEF